MGKTIYSKEHLTLVKRIRQARIDAGFDQNKVAKLLGKTQSYISKVESGQIKIGIIQLKNIAKMYRKDLDYFID